jgi:excisionase family DNA binding protein
MVNKTRKNEDAGLRELETGILANGKQTLVFTLSIEQLEPLIKSWIQDCLNYGSVSQTSDLPKYFTREEAAKVLQISLPTLHTYTKLGLIHAKRIGTRVLYSENDLQNALQDIPVKLSRR